MFNVPEPKFPPWQGAWPEDVFFSFYKLTSDESIAAIESARTRSDMGLLGLDQIFERRRARIAEYLAEVRAHEGFRRLTRFAGFKNVLAEREHLAAENGLFAEPFGEVRLVRIVGFVVGGFVPGYKPKRATLAQQRKVERATRVLRGLLLPGAQPTDLFEMSDLRRLLNRLQHQLNAEITQAEAAGTRPHRADADAAQRYWLISLCSELLRTFGRAPTEVVKEVGAMIGYTPNDATIARYIERAQGGLLPVALAADLLHASDPNS